MTIVKFNTLERQKVKWEIAPHSHRRRAGDLVFGDKLVDQLLLWCK